jgi:hypothetical protein
MVGLPTFGDAPLWRSSTKISKLGGVILYDFTSNIGTFKIQFSLTLVPLAETEIGTCKIYSRKSVPIIGLKETTVAMSATNNTSAQNAPPSVTYGFIGLGVMGYGMAKNLRSKIPKSSTLVICELVEKRRGQFVAETEGLLKVAHSPNEVAEQAVCHTPFLIFM